MLLGTLSLQAQVGRTFVLKNSADGRSELHCSLPRFPNGRAVIACPGGAYGGHGYGFASWFKYHDQMLSDLDQWLRDHKSSKAVEAIIKGVRSKK